jgi:predicted SnoaL-like aldol condensation-catalyzing enzyme
MNASPKHKTTAVQNSIEHGTTGELGLLHPTRYKQHNPNVETGVEAILALHDTMPQHEVYVNVVRAFEDGDYGFVHVDYHLFEPTVAFDIHRYEDGVSVEHWDNLQATPPGRNPSGRTMTDGKTQPKDHEKTEANKALVERFTREVLMGEAPSGIEGFFADGRLIQHNPHMGDGLAEFEAARAVWEQQGTPLRYDAVHMVLGEGNFVLVVSEGAFLGKHTAFYDLYRVEDDRIAEHWDVVEEIPDVAQHKHANGKF